MTKGKSRSLQRRRLRRATKNVNLDIGYRIGDRHIHNHYGAVANSHKFRERYQPRDI